jgi:hypothetical protein
MPRKKPPPKTLYEKARELLNDKSNSADPEMERIRKLAVNRYFVADIPLSKTVALSVVLACMVVVGTVSAIAFMNLSTGTASSICLMLTALLLILVAVLLHLTGTLSESAFMKLINTVWGKLTGILSQKGHTQEEGDTPDSEDSS